MPDVVAIGNINIDISVSIRRWPEADEKLIAERAHLSVGGAATNFAVACSKLGMSSSLIAVVGDDPLGELAVRLLKNEGVDTARIRRVEGELTGIALVISSGSSRGIISCRGANELLSPEDLDEGYISSSRAVLAASTSLGVAERAASLCSKHQVPFLLDPGGTLASYGLEHLKSTLKATYAFLPNEVELMKITGLTDIKRACEAVFSCGTESIIVKAGQRGCFTYHGDRLSHIEAIRPERVVDPTGAGDAFNAGLVLGLLKGLDIARSARLGIALATLKLQRRGASNMPALEELKDFLSSIGWLDFLEEIR